MICVKTGDFRQLGDELADDSVDLVLTDPPYGHKFLPLWGDLARVAARVLRPAGFLVAYSGQMYLPEVIAALGASLVYYWQGAIVQPAGTVRVWNRRVLQAQKPYLVYAKEPVQYKRWFTDLLHSPVADKRFHSWGQSLEPFRYLVERFSNLGDLVFDPFLGGGTTALACLQTGRDCIGYEIDPHTADVARARLAEAQLPLPLPGLTVLQGAMAL